MLLASVQFILAIGGEYSVDFKLDVVNYYLKSDEGRNLVAAKFNISPSQVYSWTKKFQQGGPEALLPVKKGRPAKMPKKSKKVKRNKQTETLTDKQKYEAILQEKDAKIKELELELIIAKKVAARYPSFPIDKRHR